MAASGGESPPVSPLVFMRAGMGTEWLEADILAHVSVEFG